MKLKYIGGVSPIVLGKVTSENKNIKTGESFECDADYGAFLMTNFNLSGKRPKFEEAKEEIKEVKKKKAQKKVSYKAEPID